MIWRLLNNGTQGGGNSNAIGDLGAGDYVDIPAELVTVRWASTGPFTSIDRMYLQNQTLTIQNTGAAGILPDIEISSTGAENIEQAELIEDYGFGRVLFSQSA